MYYVSILTPFALSLFLTAFICKKASIIGKYFGIIDMPTGDIGHKNHQNPTPAVGGLILGFVGAIIFICTLYYSEEYGGLPKSIRSLMSISVIAMMVVGFLDDRKHIYASIRLFFGAAIICMSLLVLVPELQLNRIEFSSEKYSINIGIFALTFTVICYLALQNAVNMADGKNGLILGMSIIWMTFLIFHALPNMLPSMFGILGSLIVLFIFNVQGKLFMGDCGSYGIATYLANVTLALHQNAFGNVSSTEAILLFIIPILDTTRLIYVRLASGQSPMTADGRHLHHMLDKAVGWKAGWFIYMGLVAIPLAASQFLENLDVALILCSLAAYSMVVWTCQRKSYLSETTA